MPITPLTNEEEKELLRLQRFYWKEAIRCEDGKAYLAGCLMLGSALETLLILLINLDAEEAEKTGKIPTLKGRQKPLLKWDLAELLAVAKAASWLPSALDLDDDWNWRKAKIGDYAEVVRMMRNLAHPARYLPAILKTTTVAASPINICSVSLKRCLHAGTGSLLTTTRTCSSISKKRKRQAHRHHEYDGANPRSQGTP
jgi:hypothetical protein